MPSPTLMLVDDDDVQLCLLEMQLQTMGYTDVITAHSGIEALRRWPILST